MAILRAHSHLLRAVYKALTTRHAQAALGAALLALGSNDFRVHQLDQPMIVLHVDHHYSAQDANLRPGQTHALGLIHGIGHIAQQ